MIKKASVYLLYEFLSKIINLFCHTYTNAIIFSKKLNKFYLSSTKNIKIKVRLCKENDISYFALKKFGKGDRVNTIRNADLCFIAVYNGKPIHHACVALKSFYLQGIKEKIRVKKKEAFIYNVYTMSSYRGLEVAQIVFNNIHLYLKELNVKRVYTHVARNNLSSIRAFIKSGYQPVGNLSLINFRKRNLWVAINRNYFEELCILSLPFLKIFNAYLPDLYRIREEILPFIEQWREKNHKVALFGAGGHSDLILNSIDLLKDVIGFIVDSNPKRQGERYKPLALNIFQPIKLKDFNMDVIIVSSETFQEEIINQIHQMGIKCKILTLYPNVNYIKN